jgi:hypothetical protein
MAFQRKKPAAMSLDADRPQFLGAYYGLMAERLFDSLDRSAVILLIGERTSAVALHRCRTGASRDWAADQVSFAAT